MPPGSLRSARVDGSDILFRNKGAADPGRFENVSGAAGFTASHPTNGAAFADYFELRDAVAERGDDFARGFTESLIAYGLGRPYGFTDDDLANEIISQAQSNRFEVRSFIHALTQSTAFRTK